MGNSVKGAIIAGIALVSIISWPRDTPVTFFPHNELGDANFDFFKQVVTFHKITKTLNVLEWDISGAGSQFGLGEWNRLCTHGWRNLIAGSFNHFSLCRYCEFLPNLCPGGLY